MANIITRMGAAARRAFLMAETSRHHANLSLEVENGIAASGEAIVVFVCFLAFRAVAMGMDVEVLDDGPGRNSACVYCRGSL